MQVPIRKLRFVAAGELIPPHTLEALESAGRLESATRRQLLAWGDGALFGQRGDWRGAYDEGERGGPHQLDRVREAYLDFSPS